MLAEPLKLKDYSQKGEAATIQRLLSLLPERDRYCVDVGAGSGWSNTRQLIEGGYSGLLIDADQGECLKLLDIFRARIAVVRGTVGFGEDRLDNFICGNGIPESFDFLSIDIDGNDYHVWKALEKYRPKLVCIEFNPTIPTEVHFVQSANPAVQQGASLMAMVVLGKEKGYELVAVHPFNAFFVRKDLFPFMGITDNSPHVLRMDIGYMTYLFSGYDGQVFLAGNEKMPWHPVYWNANKVQHIPRRLRKYPASYSKTERFLFNVWSIYRQTLSALKSI